MRSAVSAKLASRCVEDVEFIVGSVVSLAGPCYVYGNKTANKPRG